MEWKVIKSKAEYETALTRMMEVFDAESGSKLDELELLVLLIKDYEDQQFPVSIPDPIEAIKLRMHEMGLRNKDLVDIIGSEGHVSAVLSGKRQITLEMAKLLHIRLNIPTEVFFNSDQKSTQFQGNPAHGKEEYIPAEEVLHTMAAFREELKAIQKSLGDISKQLAIKH